MNGVVIAAAEHTPPVDHGVALLALVLIAAVGGLIYGLRRVVVKSRAGRAPADRGSEGPRDLEATRSDPGAQSARDPAA